MPEPKIEASDRSDAAALGWYLRLRWLALFGHAAVIALVHVWGFVIEWSNLGALLTLEALLAVWLTWKRPQDGPVPDRWLVALLVLDAVFLVLYLYFTGGPHNPMSVVLMVNVALAAYMLRPARAWGVVAFTLGASALLFVDSRPLVWGGAVAPAASAEPACPMCTGAAGGLDMQLHLHGMWAGYVVAGAAILWFINLLRAEIVRRDAALRDAESARLLAERRAQLATLAAGAAHELSTPLASISLAAETLGHELATRPDVSPEARDDMRVIESQVRRCREILERMAYDLGETKGGATQTRELGDVVDAALADLDGSRIRTTLDAAARALRLRTVGSAVEQSLRNLVDNGLRASSQPVRVEVVNEGSVARIRVVDEGVGMTAEDVERAGDPFFTRRAPGEGMGLGLFVARSVAEQLGGRLEIQSTPGRGTTVSLFLPLARSA